MAIVITGAMHLPVPTTQEPGPQYANDVNTCLTYLSNHTHDGSYNGGTPIDLSIQTCLGDLSINLHNLTNVRSVEFISQPSALTGSQDVNSIYVNQNNLGFNNSNGIFVPITNGNTLAVTALSLTNFSIRKVSSTFSINPTDTYNVIDMDSTGGAFSGTLPSSFTITPTASGRLFIFRDVGYACATNPITLHTGGTDVFADGGQTTFVINTNGGYAGFYTDGTGNWFAFDQNIYSYSNLYYGSSNITMDANTALTVNGDVVFGSGGSFTIDAGSTAVCNTILSFPVSGSGISTGSLSSSALDGYRSIIGITDIGGTTSFTGGASTYFTAGGITVFQSGSAFVENGNAIFQGSTILNGTITIGGSATISGSGNINTTIAGGITSSIAGGISPSIAGGISSNITGGIESISAGGILSTVSGGISTTTVAGITTALQGGIRSLYQTTFISGVSYTVVITDDYILVDTAHFTTTVLLPAPTTYPGKLFYVCDATNSADIKNIHVTTVAGTNVFYTINPVASITLATPGKSVGFISNGTFWQPIGV